MKFLLAVLTLISTTVVGQTRQVKHKVSPVKAVPFTVGSNNRLVNDDKSHIWQNGWQVGENRIVGALESENSGFIICIGRFAGYTITHDTNILVIADSYEYDKKYESGGYYVDSSYWYFTTERGKKMFTYVEKFKNKIPLTRDDMVLIKSEFIDKGWLNDISKHYKSLRIK